MQETNPYISVIVLTYRSNWDTLRKTLYSIILQTNIDFEIIICDDGSPNNHFERIKAYFVEFNFKRFLLINHTQNLGTVKNLIDGLKQAKGKYIKCISPGDFLFDKNTLRFFYQHAESNPAVAYFGRALYYKLFDNEVHLLDDKQNPRDISPWIEEDYKRIRYNYIRKRDYAVGVAFFVRKDIQLNYLLRMEDKIKYAEDYSFVMMIAEGRKIRFVDHPIVFYEYGTGVSTNGLSEWNVRISLDNKNGEQLIWPSLTLAEKLEKKRKKNLGEKILRYILTPKLIMSRIGIKNMNRSISITFTENDYINLKNIFDS